MAGRGAIRVFRYFALVGCGLSAVGMTLAVVQRIESVLIRLGPTGLTTAAGALSVMDAFKEAGVTFLLAGILYVGCEIADRESARESPRPDDD